MSDLTKEEAAEAGRYEAERWSELERRSPTLIGRDSMVEIPFGIEGDMVDFFLLAYHVRLDEIHKTWALCN